MGLFSFLKNKPQIVEKQEPKSNVTDNNERFRILSKSSMEYLRTGEIDFYRNDLFDMARILEKEGKLTDALKQYLYVFYLDTTGISSLEALRLGYKPKPMIAPGILNRIRIVRNKLKLTDAELKDLYFTCPTESIFPDAVFTYQESYELLEECFKENGTPDAMMQKAIKRYNKSHK